MDDEVSTFYNKVTGIIRRLLQRTCLQLHNSGFRESIISNSTLFFGYESRTLRKTRG
jgi:hypothetical protein